MRRVFTNIRTFYLHEWYGCGARYVGPNGNVVADEKHYHEHYENVHTAFVITCVGLGFAWGFSKDQEDSAAMSFIGIAGGAVCAYGVAFGFVYPGIVGVLGALGAVKGAAKVRHWYRQNHKKD